VMRSSRMVSPTSLTTVLFTIAYANRDHHPVLLRAPERSSPVRQHHLPTVLLAKRSQNGLLACFVLDDASRPLVPRPLERTTGAALCDADLRVTAQPLDLVRVAIRENSETGVWTPVPFLRKVSRFT
jgi:hypothetical protein